MIVINRKGVVYMTHSFRDMPLYATIGDITNCDENLNMWHPEGDPRRLIGIGNKADMASRAADILRYSEIFPNRLTKKKLMDETFYRIYNALDDFDLCDKNSTGISAFFAEKGKAYIVNSRSGIFEIEEIMCSAAYEQAILASYIKNKENDDVYKIIREIYKNIENLSTNLQFPVVVMNTKNGEKVIIEREERA